MDVRRRCTQLHRWSGLVTAVFLVIAGMTGSILAFAQPLDRWLNPDLFVVAPRFDAHGQASPMLDPFVLHEQAEQALPDFTLDAVPLRRTPTSSVIFGLRPTSRDGPASINQAFFDPYTGRLLGARRYGATLLDRRTIVGFLYRIHYSLALPAPWGPKLMGAIALVWTVNCFLGLMTTFPRHRPFLGKWLAAWKIKPRAGVFRLNLDLHRASGLWLWSLMLLYAWSSVMFNLGDEIYKPIMSRLFRFQETSLGLRPSATQEPMLDWRVAYDVSRTAMANLARQKGFTVNFPDVLIHDRTRDVFFYYANTTRDINAERGQTAVIIDDRTGAPVGSRIPTGEAAGDTISRWLHSLHQAVVFGRPYRILVAFFGLVVATVSITGIVMWWKKHIGRLARRRTLGQ